MRTIKNFKKELKNVKILQDRQIYQGAKMSLENSERLIKSAKVLLKNNGNIASSLLILALEELGRSSFLLILASQKYNKILWKMFWKNYRQHDVKLEMAIPAFTLGASLAKNKEFSSKFENKIKKTILTYNKIKQEAFYISFSDKENKFVLPNKKKREQFAQENIDFTKESISFFKKYIFKNYTKFIKFVKMLEDISFLEICKHCSGHKTCKGYLKVKKRISNIKFI